MTGEQTEAGFPRPVPVEAGLGGVDSRTPTPPRPAVFPLYPRFSPRPGDRADVCVVVTSGVLAVVARDVLEAIGRDAGEYSTNPGHNRAAANDWAWTYSDHATAATWSRDLIHDIVSPIAEHDEIADRFLRWLDERLSELVALGLDTVERRVLYGTGQKPSPDAPDDAAPSGPAFYSVAAAARILSRDPAIGKLGRDALFELLNRWSWIHRTDNAWRPDSALLLTGVLLQQDVHVTQYSKTEPYPQILITPLGIEALHAKLGGTAALELNRSHLTLI